MHEQLLEKIAAGESVGIDDVLRADAAVKLAEMQAEANRRAEVRRIEEGRQQTREQKLDEMVFLDGQAEAARRQLENVVSAKAILLADLEKAEKEAVAAWHRSHSNFVAKFAGFVPEIRSMSFRDLENQAELEKKVSELKAELKQRGARLENVLFNYSNRGQSYLEIPNMPVFNAAETIEPTEPKAAESVAGL
jgi:DNA repair exonuclease SbcCD ATPase subunit